MTQGMPRARRADIDAINYATKNAIKMIAKFSYCDQSNLYLNPH